MVDNQAEVSKLLIDHNREELTACDDYETKDHNAQNETGQQLRKHQVPPVLRIRISTCLKGISIVSSANRRAMRLFTQSWTSHEKS